MLKWLRLRKAVLLAVIAVTALAPLAFVDYEESSAGPLAAKFLAKSGSLVATVLFTWQFVLGVRTVSSRLLPDILWGYRVHRLIGTWAAAGLLLHPIFITVYYLQVMERNPLALDLSEPFSLAVLVGMIALAVLAVIVLSSTVLRPRLERDSWYRLHLLTWLFLPLVFVHSLPIGMTLSGSALRFGWYALIAVLIAVALMRVLLLAGLHARRYRVVSAETVGPDVTLVWMEPLAVPLAPQIGQFVYIRLGRWGAARPYTASHYDHATGRLGVTIKAFGGVSRLLEAAEAGDVIFIDGSYGVFLLPAIHSHRPIVMIAGGIGITPFLRLIEKLESDGEQASLFYGNQKSDEIVFGPQLSQTRHVKVVDVLSDEPDWPGEKGFVTPELIRRHLGEDLTKYEFLVCGPPAMTKALTGGLAARDVPNEQIHHELFGL